MTSSLPSTLQDVDDNESFPQVILLDDGKFEDTSLNTTSQFIAPCQRVSFLTTTSFFNNESNNSALLWEDSYSNFAADDSNLWRFSWDHRFSSQWQRRDQGGYLSLLSEKQQAQEKNIIWGTPNRRR